VRQYPRRRRRTDTRRVSGTVSVADRKPLLIITPRHPQRFDQVAGMLETRGIAYVRRSTLDHDTVAPIASDVQVLLGDTMGEMYMYYAAADVAFVGGSLVPLGGHNLIEACAMGKAVLTGLHTFNFSEITDQAIAAGAALRVDGARSMLREALALLGDDKKRNDMGQHAYAFFYSIRAQPPAPWQFWHHT
jgi:3-deoxy-D-manno-octulosonic-acid transferase